MSKYLDACQDEAMQLHALAQGAVELHELTPSHATPASNALYALLTVIVDKAEALAAALDSTSRRRAIAAQGEAE